MKVVIGLGNPGSEYDATRHNVGWWVTDRLAYDWAFGPFERMGKARVSEGRIGDETVLLMKPTTFMNRSGAALRTLETSEEFSTKEDLLVVVDDASMDVGRVRFRPEGGSGGHNGLKSIAGALRSNEYGRLRIGVGRKPEGEDLADWVLSEMPAEDEDTLIELLPELSVAVETWVRDGIEVAMNDHNR